MVSSILASSILVVRNFARLIFSPYTTMRKISSSWDLNQAVIIWGLVYIYFVYRSTVRFGNLSPAVIFQNSSTLFVYFFITFLLLVSFFVLIGELLCGAEEGSIVSKSNINSRIKKVIMVFSYSLLPTLVWFFVTSSLYIVWPPPRFPTVLGKTYTIIFLVFSVTLLMWKIVLWYLSLRFSFRMGFYTILFAMILFMTWFLPFSIFMYTQSIFRIPFI